ncbi:MAG: TetR/AcrR family transcriptional regulator [Dehalococcoidia bacterium]
MPRNVSRAAQSTANGDTRNRILQVARTLFAENGYSGTSVRLIARELGLSDPAVYYHFPSKQHLYEALLDEPDYGVLPLDVRPLNQESLIDQILHMFAWWSERPELARMLLREQLAGEESSVAFLLSRQASWHEGVTVPLRQLLGADADGVSTTLFDLSAGVFWDAILSFGERFNDSVRQPYFQRRLRRMIELAVTGERLEHSA